MMTRSASLPWLIALLLLAVTSAMAQEMPSTAPAATAPADPAQLEYIEAITAGADAESALPMIIVVHGLGDRPENFIRVFDAFPIAARIIAPRAPTRQGRGYSWFPVQLPVKADDAAMTEGIRASATRLAALAHDLAQRRPTIGKPVITGFSQGGILSFAVALHHPDTIAAAVPVAGALPPALTDAAPMASATDRRPVIRALHGAADKVVPFFAAKLLVIGLAGQGYDATMQSFAEVGHGIPPEMRRAVFAAITSVLPR